MMNSMSMVEARLPPGFRFHPRDDELVLDYLMKKLAGGRGVASSVYGWPFLVDVDLNKCEPWDLPEIACVGGKEWYFYSLKDKKYATGQRTNRATESGYWKATGKDRLISRRGLLVGMRKTLVFYRGRAPRGKKTDWVMHEFRREGQGDSTKLPFKEDWVLCRVFYKSRATMANPRMETSCNDHDQSLASMPLLIDNYIAFDGYDQVPCFSKPSHAPSSSSSISTPSIPVVGGQQMGKAIKDVLSQFTRFEGTVVKREVPQGFTQDGFESYYLMTNNGLSQMLNSSTHEC